MIDIISGDMKAAIAPALGGVVLSLSYQGRDLLRRSFSADSVASDPREAACYPLVPWFSRLPGGLDFGGRRYPLDPTLPACDRDHALHGHGWVSPWEVTKQSTDRLACQFDYAPGPRRFPFPFRAAQIFSIDEDAFHIELSVQNTGDAAMPAGLGLHPFFPRDADTQLSFSGRAAALTDKAMDDSFPDWGGRAQIAQPDGGLEVVSNAAILHLYAPNNEQFFCAEPVSHLPGEVGKTTLAPGELLKIFLKIAPISA